MTVLSNLLGVVIIILALSDIFQTLFSPRGGGTFSSRLTEFIWSAAQFMTRRGMQVLPYAGPTGLMVVIFAWATALSLGWAFIFWPHLESGFVLPPGENPDLHTSFLDALYVSTVTITTLGYGDITPVATWLRLIGPLEALIGFGLITASISWVVTIREVLGRQHQLAREIVLLRRSDKWDTEDYGKLRANTLEGTLLSLANQVILVRDDISSTPVAYYFHTADAASALPANLYRILPLVSWAENSGTPSVQMQAELLRIAIDDLADYLGEEFLDMPDADTAEVLRAFARDHCYEIEKC